MIAGHIASERSSYLVDTFAEPTARAMLTSHVNCAPVGGLIGSDLQEQVRRETREEPFRNISEWATWPKREVFRFLAGVRHDIGSFKLF
jgi:hypothetical protein